MNKADLINHLSMQLGGRRAATVAVEAMVDVVIREVAAGGNVGITGFGTFERAERAPRTGRNPRTGDLVPIAGTTSPRFRPGTHFKAMVAEPDLLPAEGMAGGRAPAGSASRPAKTTTLRSRVSSSTAKSSKTKPAKDKSATTTSATDKTARSATSSAKSGGVKASKKDTPKKGVTKTSGAKGDDKKKGGKKKSGKKKK